MFRSIFFVLILLAVCWANLTAVAQPKPDAVVDLDKDRQQRIEQLREAGVPNPERIRTEAKRIFGLPIEGQEEAALRRLAREANAYANLVDTLQREYANERRDNLRYDFVLKVLSPPHDAYVRISNEFKDIRNKSYMNLAKKAEVAGDKLQAFQLYADAFRLSTFICQNKTGENCIRLIAEREMQRLLGISGVSPYTRWE